MRLYWLAAPLCALGLVLGCMQVHGRAVEAAGAVGLDQRVAAPGQKAEPAQPSGEQGRGQTSSSAGAECSIADLVTTMREAVVGVTTRRSSEAPLMNGDTDDFWQHFFGDTPPASRGHDDTERGLGSGFIIEADGLVVTNYHVVEGADEVRVRTAADIEYRASVRGADPATDVALLQIKNLDRKLTAAPLGDSDKLRVGDCVVAIGNPFGLELTVTRGIISAKGREIGETPFDQFLQTDAAINPGNSGGPLFDLQGRVVGINTAIVATGQGIGFAVPINLVKSLLPQLRQNGRVVRGYIGVSAQDLNPRLAEALGVGVDKGAVVASVVADGPGAKAGLQVGDVIIAVGGQPVESAGDLSRRVASFKPGSTAAIDYLRKAQKHSTKILLAERPAKGREAPPPQPKEESAEQEGGLGLRLRAVPPEVLRTEKIDGGVLVVSVDSGSRASMAGLESGDIILEADGKPVRSVADLRGVASKARSRTLLLRIVREHSTLFVAVPGEQKG
jgi:serine protease Do